MTDFEKMLAADAENREAADSRLAVRPGGTGTGRGRLHDRPGRCGNR